LISNGTAVKGRNGNLLLTPSLFPSGTVIPFPANLNYFTVRE